MRRTGSLVSVISMVSVANENGGSESTQESKTTCNSAAGLSTGSVSFNRERPKEEEHEEDDDDEDSHEEEEEEHEDEDGSECSPNKRLKACLGTVEEEDEEINSRLEILQTLVPGGHAMDAVSLLEQTACYIKLLGGVVNAAKLC